MLITRRAEFSSSHVCAQPLLSAEENRELYGKCNNPYGHGHDYVLDVSVTGPVDTASGQVVNIQVLDRLVGERILHDFDHKYLNADVREFGEAIPTSENIIRVMENRLQAHWRDSFAGEWPRLEKIRLRETRRNAFELVS